MKHLSTAALALVLAAGAMSAQADDPNNPNDKGAHTGQHPGGNGGGNGGPHTNGGNGGGNGGSHTNSGNGGPGAGQGGNSGGGQGGQGGNSGGSHFTPQAVGGQGGVQGGQGGNRGGNGGGNGGGGPPRGGQQFGNGQGGGGGQRGGFSVGIGVGGGHVGLGLQFRQHSLRGRDQGRAYFQANMFQRSYRATRRFNAGRFYSPPGWYSRNWAYGEFLPQGWFAPNYYLNWEGYGLPAPPIGCEWVREGPDALLVDVWTGEILSVYQGVFW